MADKNLTTIYLVRHGESEGNIKEDSSMLTPYEWGEFGSPLSKKGVIQARDRADKFKHIKFDAFYSSDMTRAKQTAEIIALEKDLVVQTQKLIRERVYRNLKMTQNKTRQAIELDMLEALKALDEKAKMSYKYGDDMESAEEAAGRLITFLREIALLHSGKTVLVTNHGNNIRCMLTHLGWAKYDELPKGSIDNTGYVVLESDGIDFFIKETQGIHKQQGTRRGF